ncbi:BAG family molecular chaperone regulator 5 [Rhynchospora pubera]|uniref:BAG family molecular chaperone regulator 5 n=1 Tax=Rhynchospora pubera TaxID=906938 RepID=A0AAV8FXD3_9POAL|nr:BAG family molecular chaperone regulator 5 [Rhynchospora pubera]
MEGYYYGYPSRNNYSFYPYSNPNPNRYMNPYYNSNSNPNHFLNPYHNSNPQPNQYRNPYQNSNPSPNHFINPYHNSNSQANQFHDPNSNNQHNPKTVPKPRVVSIPIQFVNSDAVAMQPPTVSTAPVAPARPSPDVAAVKLQKVIRGFLVRKNFGIVRKIEAEAEGIGEEIARDEKVLEKEVKARIRVGEMLMNLLFRLDSIRGVRDYRKKVIRKVISLQELVDSIGARADKVQSDTIEAKRTDSVKSTAQNPNSDHIEEKHMVEEGDSMLEALVKKTNSIDINDSTENMVVEAVDSMEESRIEPIKLTESPEAKESDEVFDPTETLEMDESVRGLNAVDQAPESSQVVRCNENKEMEMKGVRDVMERVVLESEKMKNLMEELCKSSARQWQLMEGLVDRVQRLEKEVAKMERRDKKKRKGHGRKCDSCSKKCNNL